MKPQPNFNHIARPYRSLEYLTLGRTLERCRLHYLPQLTPHKQALILGDGDGRFLARLLQQQHNLHALAVDTSPAMLQLLRTRCNNTPHLNTLQSSALNIDIPPHTDLIVTHFFLDCLTQPEVDTLTTKIAAHTQPGTLWLLSDFELPTASAIRPFAKLYIRALYFAFGILTGLRVQTLPNPQSSLQQSGFTRIARHQKLFGLIYTELWSRI